MSHNGRKTLWSLRDNPAALAVGVVGTLAVLVVLGWLTLRIGSIWVRNYTHRHIEADQ